MSTISLNSHSFARYKGLAMAFSAAALWGLSGAVVQTLFQNEGIRPGWLVTVRLLCAGALLLLYGLSRNGGQPVWAVWKKPKDRIQLIVFGLLGMLGVQYTYFAAINAGNAATATILQYLGPVFITVFVSLRDKRMPNLWELLALGMALLGTFLLVTNGSVSQLSISGAAVFWGIGAALTAAFYTLYPVGLLKRWSSIVVVGWGMLIGGVGLSLLNPPWDVSGQHLTMAAVLPIGFVILFGTLIPFYLILESLRYISAAEAGMLNSAEPLAAVIVSVVWLHLSFGFWEMVGGLCIIVTVTLLALNSGRQESSVVSSAIDSMIDG